MQLKCIGTVLYMLASTSEKVLLIKNKYKYWNLYMVKYSTTNYGCNTTWRE